MDSLSSKRNRTLYLLAFLWALFLLVSKAEGSVKLPPVEELPELSWSRQPFFPMISRWDLDPVLFPAENRAAGMPKQGPGGQETPESLFQRARRKAEEARNYGDDAKLHEEAARLYMRAYAAARGGETGFEALSLAARSFLLAGRYAEAEGAATRLISRAGTNGASLPFYLLKGEALFRRGNYLSARECFRRAASGQWDVETRRRIDLRIADVSFLLGNPAFAEPAYRKTLLSPGARFGAYPFETIRFGETLLAAGRAEEALQVFRRLHKESIPANAHVAACLGEGDALLVLKRYALAEYAYHQAALWGDHPEMRWWVQCRFADLSFATGRRKEAAARYRELSSCPEPSVAREAGYKWILSLYLAADHEGVVREAGTYLLRNAEKAGAGNVRRMAAKAGAEIVRAVGSRDPAKKWPAFFAFLFSFARSAEGKALFADMGREWEEGRIWGGAGVLYQAAGDKDRGGEMMRIESAERAYFRGDLDGVLTALGYGEARRESSPAALWLLARTFFRQGRYEQAAEALGRLDHLSPEPPGVGHTARKELAAFARAMQGQRKEALDSLKEMKSPPPTSSLAFLLAWADDRPPSAREGEVREKDKGKKTPGDLWADLAAGLQRYRRLMGEGAE